MKRDSYCHFSASDPNHLRIPKKTSAYTVRRIFLCKTLGWLGPHVFDVFRCNSLFQYPIYNTNKYMKNCKIPQLPYIQKIPKVCLLLFYSIKLCIPPSTKEAMFLVEELVIIRAPSCRCRKYLTKNYKPALMITLESNT